MAKGTDCNSATCLLGTIRERVFGAVTGMSFTNHGGEHGKGPSSNWSELDSEVTELSVLRTALKAARAEIRASAAEARAAKEAARAAEKALKRERRRREQMRFGRALRRLWAQLRLMPGRIVNAPAGSGEPSGTESVPSHNSLAKTMASSTKLVERKVQKRESYWDPSTEVANYERPPVQPGVGIDIPDLFTLKSMKQGGRLAIVLHHTQADLWPKIRQALTTIPETFDLFVSLLSSDPQLRAGIASDFPMAQFISFDGEVSAFLPLIALINSGVLFKYDLVCNIDGSKVALSRVVLSDAANVAHLLRAFDADPDLGIVAAEQERLSREAEAWLGAFTTLYDLSARLGIEALTTQSEALDFPRDLVCWIRPFLFRPLAALKLTTTDISAASRDLAIALQCLTSLVCRDAGMHCVAAATDDLMQIVRKKNTRKESPKVSIIAFYLPQFHPIPENDIWWQPGFTEWTHVTQARPRFRWHRQPRLPADLGYYDLRLPEIREAQAALARRYGVTAFCYYYYWFDGKKLLDRPLREVLSTGSPDFPFLICWANEPWTRGWHGKEREILVPQLYTPGWPRAFAAAIAPILKDSRYFRFLGDPLLLIYRIMSIPDPKSALEELRDALREYGLNRVHIAAAFVQFPGEAQMPVDPSKVGLDSVYDFRPKIKPRNMSQAVPKHPDFTGNIYLYDDLVRESLRHLEEPTVGIRHRIVVMGWDNTPRRPMTGTATHGATPANFRRWLRAVMQHELHKVGPDERIIFINAWNEWGEGTYLEPDQDFGRGWLEAVASAIVP